MGLQDVGVERVAHLLVPGEGVLAHGPARWAEVERTGRGRGRGVLVATSRRLVFRADDGDEVVEIPYDAVERARRTRKLLTHDLIVVVRGGDAVTFSGNGRLLRRAATAVAAGQRVAALASPRGIAIVCSHGRTMCTFCWPPSGLPDEGSSNGR